MKSGQALVCDFTVHQDVRHDADDLGAAFECSVRQHTHQSDSRAAIDQAHASNSDVAAQLFRSLNISRPSSICRAAEDADAEWLGGRHQDECSVTAAVLHGPPSARMEIHW
jgi:hypothetical protein